MCNIWLFLHLVYVQYICYYKYKLRKEKNKEENDMKKYRVEDKHTNIIIGILVMTPEQARKAEKDFIIKEV